MQSHGPEGNKGLISRIFSKVSEIFGKTLIIQVKLSLLRHIVHINYIVYASNT